MEWTPQRLTELATGYWASGALLAAVELGLFDALSDRTGTPTEIAAALLQPVAIEHIDPLMRALAALHLVDESAGRYTISATARPLLSRGSAGSMLDALAYNAGLFRKWGSLAQVLSASVETPRSSSREAHNPAALRRFVYGMESKAQALAPAIADCIDLNGAGTLLDVGAGPGTLSRRLAAREQKLHVTLLDLPEVLTIARDITAGDPAIDRLRFHPADYNADALPGGFNVTLFAGALHQEPRPAAARLARKLFDSLHPGGTVFIIDIMLNDDRISPPFATLFQLNMLLSRPDARVYSGAEVQTLLADAGFAQPEQVEIPQSIYRIVKARKPEARS
jgi:2-polyprenyl-3-methyl-5-hydroxy-6-metoxy-1,4-benzoquinol methylase